MDTNKAINADFPQNRSDLCASVPYFDSYQGSTYTKNGIVKGMLLDQDAGVRQYMDDEVVIVRAGGSMGYDETGKTSVQVKNQDGTSSGITSFRNTMDRKVPLILIVGKCRSCRLIDNNLFLWCHLSEFEPEDCQSPETKIQSIAIRDTN